MKALSNASFLDLIDEQNRILLHVVKKFRIVQGKKALHKILYFLDLDLHKFSYRWDNYGPYSQEVKYLFEDAVDDGFLDIDPIPLKNKNAKQYNMSISEKGIDFTNKNTLNSSLKGKIDNVYNILKDKTPRQMELLASVHYIIKDNGCKTEPEFILDVIRSLKPESGFTLKDIKKSILQLKDFQLV